MEIIKSISLYHTIVDRFFRSVKLYLPSLPINISLYIIKRFRRCRRRRVKNPEGGGGWKPNYSKSP